MSDFYRDWPERALAAAEQLARHDPFLKVVRGHAIDSLRGKFRHAWCETPEGKYVEALPYEGFHMIGIMHWSPGDRLVVGTCSECGDRIERPEHEWTISGPWVFCGSECEKIFVWPLAGELRSMGRGAK